MFAQRLRRVSQSFKGVRQMGHHAPAPQGGLDGFVRKFLPEDHHVAMGMIGFYVSLFLLSKLGGSKKEESASTPTAVVVATSNGAIPSVDSPEFDSWLSAPGNIDKFFA